MILCFQSVIFFLCNCWGLHTVYSLLQLHQCYWWWVSCHIRRLQGSKEVEPVLLQADHWWRAEASKLFERATGLGVERADSYYKCWYSCNCLWLQESSWAGHQALLLRRWCRLVGSCSILEKPQTSKVALPSPSPSLDYLDIKKAYDLIWFSFVD